MVQADDGHGVPQLRVRVQVRHEASPLQIPPRSGILTSCSMYLKEHFVVLNQGAGNFGIHGVSRHQSPRMPAMAGASTIRAVRIA